MICPKCKTSKHTFLLKEPNKYKCMWCNKEFEYIEKEDLIIAVDFDTVLATYNRPFKYNKLGEPNKEFIKILQDLKEDGYRRRKIKIVVFTGRLETQKLYDWLNKNKVPYDGINENLRVHKNASRFKLYYDVLIDDKGMNFHYKYSNIKNVKKEIEKVLEWSLEGKD